MKKNMGNADRLIRVLIAISLGVLYFTGTVSGVTGGLLLVIAGVFVATSFVGLCPLYAIFGMNTCSVKKTS